MRPYCRTGTKPLPRKTPHCPDEKGLQALAAGIAPLGFMEDHGGHIANCDSLRVSIEKLHCSL